MPTRSMKDAALIASVALPAAGAAAQTAALDLQKVDATFERIEVEVSTPALPNLVAGKKVTATLQDSDDGATFADIAIFAPLAVALGVAGGAKASAIAVRLPSTTRRYIRATLTVEAAAGDNTAAKGSLALLF